VHLPHVRIRAPCYDTCGECTVFKNAFLYQEEKNKKKGIAKDDSDDDIDEDSDAEFDEPQDCNVKEKKTSAIAESFLSGNCAEEEAIIQAASYHVEQAKVMRELAQMRAQEAKDDIANDVMHPNKRYCIVCDYAQNLGIPHFGKEQHGDMYYYSPLTINLFGLVDLSRSPNKLDCYAYREFTGEKGSNNVTSLLMYNLH
jgi:hypothetical protein